MSLIELTLWDISASHTKAPQNTEEKRSVQGARDSLKLQDAYLDW